MARTVLTKELINARLLKEYASWVYCTGCGKTVAYLCYVTYDNLDFSFTCKCGCVGSVKIKFSETQFDKYDKALNTLKNRLCCPTDDAPLLTIVEKNVEHCKLKISCVACAKEFSLEL